ncbi:MAG TPA: hypothetical protein VNW47_13760 [Terriglobales bacterium]|nr:hypothetical protein [Terriglobales bacterium]
MDRATKKTRESSTRFFLAQILSLALMCSISTLAGGQTGGNQTAGPANQMRDSDTTQWQIAEMDRFLDKHPETAEQLRKDPSLIRNEEFVSNHPELQEFLRDHTGIREEFAENPNAFMRREQRFEGSEGDRDRDRDGDRDRDHDVTRGELSTMDRFLDRHREIAEQLQKDPSLVKNKEFVENHPALKEFLQTHPEIREEFRENPNAFMRQEERYDRREDRRAEDANRAADFHDANGHNSGREVTGFHSDAHRDHDVSSFGQFLGGHSAIAEQLSRDPSLANNKEFLASHADLQEYLTAHPEVSQELAKNPQGVITSAVPPANKAVPPANKVVPPANGTTANPNLQPNPNQ